MTFTGPFQPKLFYDSMIIKAISVAFDHFLVLMFYLRFYCISLPDYPGSFFCLVPVPWCLC